MARGRMLSSSLGGSRKFSRLTNNDHRLIYCLLLPHADAYGRVEADADYVKGTVLSRVPVDPETVDAALEEMAEVGLINLYEVDGFWYAEFVDFNEHNRTYPEREAQTSIPGPDGNVPQRPPRNDQDTPSQTQTTPKATRKRDSGATKSRPTTDNVTRNKKRKEKVKRKEKEHKDLSAHADAPPTFTTLAEIWNRESGDLRKVRDLEAARNNPDLKRLAAAFLKRHGPRAVEIFTAGISAVRTDPHWLGTRASPVKRSGAPYGLLNYLRHVEDKAEIAAELQATSSGPPAGRTLPARPWEDWDIAQHRETGIVEVINQVLPDGMARMQNGETWNLSECDRCNN